MQQPSYGPEARAAFLKNSNLFAKLAPASLAALAALSGTRQYDKGGKVFARGEPAHGLFLVMAGRVKLFRLSADGREQVLEVFGPGVLFGEVPMFDGGEYPVSCEAVEDSALLYLSRDGFLKRAAEDPALTMGIIGLLAGRLRNFIELIDDLALKDVAPRFARFLLKEAEGSKVKLRIPKRVLASCLGTSPETVSRTLTRLQDEGIITTDGRLITILEPKKLEAMLEGE
jgi:CRP/FNR family transcriptional regulator